MEQEDKNLQAQPSETQEKPEKQPLPKGYEAYLSLFDLVRMLAVITLVFVFFFRLNGVSGSSMYPTLVDKDYLVLESNFLYRDAKQGDIVVLYTPPFSEMLTVTASGLNEAHVFQACRYVRDRLDNIIGRDGSAVVLGPAPLAVVKVNNRYRYRVIIYGKKLSGLRGIVSGLVIECCTDKRFSDVSVYADNDPAE
mgnify:CR=1 FL=1